MSEGELDRLLLRRFAGKVRRGPALEVSHRRELSTQVESSFAPILITYSKTSDNATERIDNTGANTCSQ